MRAFLIGLIALFTSLTAGADWQGLRYDYARTPAGQMYEMPLKVALRAAGSAPFTGTLSSGQFLAPDGTAAAPSYSFSGYPNKGMYSATAGSIDFSIAGTRHHALAPSAFYMLGANADLIYGPSSDLHVRQYAPKQLSITGDGTGATTNAGWILGYFGSNGYSGMWSSTVVPGSTNYSFAVSATENFINATSAIYFKISDGTKITQLGTLGAGPSITAGTATTPVHGFSVTQTGNAAGAALALFSGTWNNAASDTGVKIAITDTSSAAGSLPFQVLGGAAGTTNLFYVDKNGTGLFGLGAAISAAGAFQWLGRSLMYSPSDGVVRFTNNAGTSGGTLQLGGEADSSLSRISAGVIGVGTGAAGSVAGTLQLTALMGVSNVLEQRNSTNAQTFRVYNTFTDASNYERLSMAWESNVFVIKPAGAGTGSDARVIQINLGGSGANGSNNRIQGGANLVDIYAAGAPYLRVGISEWGSQGFNSGNGLQIYTPNWDGVTNRASDPIIMNVRGGSGNADPGAFIVKTAPTGASGTTGHTSEESFRVRTPSTGVYIASFGGTTSSFPALRRNGATLEALRADASAYTDFAVGDLKVGTKLTVSGSAPTIASGGCTSPAVTWNNGTAAFLLTVGTSCAGVTTITLTLPAASNLWKCHAENNTSEAANDASYMTSRATSTTAVVLKKFARTTGVAADLTASDTILVSCMGG